MNINFFVIRIHLKEITIICVSIVTKQKFKFKTNLTKYLRIKNKTSLTSERAAFSQILIYPGRSFISALKTNFERQFKKAHLKTKSQTANPVIPKIIKTSYL